MSFQTMNSCTHVLQFRSFPVNERKINTATEKLNKRSCCLFFTVAVLIVVTDLIHKVLQLNLVLENKLTLSGLFELSINRRVFNKHVNSIRKIRAVDKAEILKKMLTS